MEEEEQVQIVYPIVPRPLPPRDKKVRPSKTPHMTVAMAVAMGAAGYRRLSERDYFGTRATWLSEKGYCDASGHAVAVSEQPLKNKGFFFLTSGEINRQVRDVKLVGFTMTL